MKKKNPLITALVMIATSLIFFIFALGNPQASFEWSNTITYILLALYGVITVALLVIGLKKK